MKVTLNIENDAELRAYIKDAIKGQVLAIVRDEFLQIIKDELERKIKGIEKPNFDNMVKEAMKSAISNILYKEHQVASWNSNFINPIVERCVENALLNKNWNQLVDTLAKQKVQALLK